MFGLNKAKLIDGNSLILLVLISYCCHIFIMKSIINLLLCSCMDTILVASFFQMLIDLKNQVLVLDEAHNIEDASRTAASLEVTESQLEDVKEELSDICESVIQ